MNTRWTKLYEDLEAVLRRFLLVTETIPNLNPSPKFLLDLMPANGNLGEALLRRNIMADVRRYLDGVEMVGAPGVGLQIQFPLFDGEIVGRFAAERYLEFYGKVAAEIRRRDMVFFAETSPVFANTRFSDMPVDYAGMTPASYIQRRVEMARTIADVLQPDFLSLAHEVGTERMLTGLDVTDGQMVAALTDLCWWHDGETLIGGGIPTWEMANNGDMIGAYADAGDFFNAHLYPVVTGRGVLEVNHLTELMYRLVLVTNRKVIGETWLYKVAGWELLAGNPMDRASDIYARDPYAIWEPLDTLFLQAVHRLAQIAGVQYINLFWSRHCFAYWRQPGRADEVALNRDVMQAIKDGTLTETGEMCRKLNQAG